MLVPHHLQHGSLTTVRAICHSALKTTDASTKAASISAQLQIWNTVYPQGYENVLPQPSEYDIHAPVVGSRSKKYDSIDKGLVLKSSTKKLQDSTPVNNSALKINKSASSVCINGRKLKTHSLDLGISHCPGCVSDQSNTPNLPYSLSNSNSSLPSIWPRQSPNGFSPSKVQKLHRFGSILCGSLADNCTTCAGHWMNLRSFHSDNVKLTDGKFSAFRLVKKKPPWRIMFFGTDQIAVDTLKELHENMISSGSLVESLDVVTIQDKHERPVRKFADYAKLNLLEWPIQLDHEKYDVGVLVSFGHLIPDSIIHMFPYGILNMHPSLLPRWRGASPIIHTILNGDRVTGISIMEIRPRHFDIGPLLLQRQFLVPPRCTSLQLANIAGRSGASMVMECLKDLPTLEKFEHEQDPAGIIYAHKIKSKNAHINWLKQTAFEVDCQYRAIGELFTLKTELDGKTVKLQQIVDPALLTGICTLSGYGGDIRTARPGTVGYHRQLDCLVIKCKEGIVGFKTLILRKTLHAKDFYNGYLTSDNSVVFSSVHNDINKYAEYERMPLRQDSV